jgi:hypothetical protein
MVVRVVVAIVTRANMLFVQAVADRALVFVQNPIILGEHSEPEPDLALIRLRDDFYALALPRADEVLLIVEVADTTLRYDGVEVDLSRLFGTA